jgi:hypothetical protein
LVWLVVQEYKDDGHAYLYILFVLMFYGFSIVVLMVKYIKREREGHRKLSHSHPTCSFTSDMLRVEHEEDSCLEKWRKLNRVKLFIPVVYI